MNKIKSYKSIEPRGKERKLVWLNHKKHIQMYIVKTRISK